MTSSSKKIGRPRDSESRRPALYITCTSAERDEIEKAARLEGDRNYGVWARRVLLKAARKINKQSIEGGE